MQLDLNSLQWPSLPRWLHTDADSLIYSADAAFSARQLTLASPQTFACLPRRKAVPELNPACESLNNVGNQVAPGTKPYNY